MEQVPRTSYQSEAERWLTEQYRRPYYPYTGKTVAGLTPLEKGAQSYLGQYLGGMGGYYGLGKEELSKTLTEKYDPYTSPYYQSMRTGALREEEEAVNRLRQGAVGRGTLYSTPTGEAEASLRAHTSNVLSQILGGLSEAERGRRFQAPSMLSDLLGAELGQLGGVSGLAALPRTIEQADLASVLEEYRRKQEWPFKQAGLAGMILGSGPEMYMPGYTQGTNWEALGGSGLGAIGAILAAVLAGSSKKFKKNITQLDERAEDEALEKLTKTPLFNYRYKMEDDNAPLRVGMIAEEAPKELVHPSGLAIELYEYIAMVHLALKSLARKMEA